MYYRRKVNPNMNGYTAANNAVCLRQVSCDYSRAVLLQYDDIHKLITRDNIRNVELVLDMPNVYKSILLCMGVYAEPMLNKTPQFNYAIVEKCSREYNNVNFRSYPIHNMDETACICIKSLYQNYNLPPTRKIVVMETQSGDIINEIVLEHNSIIIITPEHIRDHMYKIIPTDATHDNDWLGITALESH